jgi:peptide/nickel transport system ATP-binding protein
MDDIDENAVVPDHIITVNDLHVSFQTLTGRVRALNGVGFAVRRGEVLGIVGESGCGKSMTGLAILQIVPQPGCIDSGTIFFDSGNGTPPIDLLKLDWQSEEMRHLRGNSIGMIFQEPMTSLNPSYSIGNQIQEALRLHHVGKSQLRERVIDILRRVEMPNPERVARSYPHQLSGGMRQRAMIAMALSCSPLLLIADEPTTALDVTTEAQILELMRQLQQDAGMSIIFITHNMGVVAQMCDEVAVMYLGRIVEQAPIDELFDSPKHPYTISLLRSIPHLGSDQKGQLETIKGSVPDSYTYVAGCSFHPRCPLHMEGLCDRAFPEISLISAQHHVRCHLYLQGPDHETC